MVEYDGSLRDVTATVDCIPLIVGDHNAALPVLDSTRLLACAALRHAQTPGEGV